ncbi:sigma-70 family RNA polymerase sigma factor [Arthrobacter cheniae]|uniref:Sigma-70 family RNA polymerase sigma factor n=1 Tax=Arthrobacter cheniae TaxID=1258888 RepID=A0A3A5M694_9MICC|nr:ECF RNA polymerase sigma factor SigK [Arthrobacter cheniae]RJT75126.1 sigma-70 family RNA polymerase sigma factor [Arthrobacter cheniae]
MSFASHLIPDLTTHELATHDPVTDDQPTHDPGTERADKVRFTSLEGPERTADLSALLIAVGGGDERAFEELYRLTRCRVHGLVCRVLIDAEISAEVTQEVFLVLWQTNAARYHPAKGSPMGWLMTLTHRRAVDRVRSEQARRVRDLNWGTSHQDTDYDQVSETVIDNEEAASVRTCLGILTPPQREAIDLAYYRGFTYVDVANRLGIPVPTAKTRIRDGIKKLGACLRD